MDSTGFEELSGIGGCHPTPKLRDRHLQPGTAVLPRYGAISPESRQLAAQIRQSIDTTNLMDAPVNALNFYMAYLQGTVLFRHEVDVVRYCIANLSTKTGDLIANSLEYAAKYLNILKWGQRLHRSLMAITRLNSFSGVAAVREARKDVLRAVAKGQLSCYDIMQQYITAPPRPEGALVQSLFSRISFWKDLTSLELDGEGISGSAINYIPVEANTPAALKELLSACAGYKEPENEAMLPGEYKICDKSLRPAAHHFSRVFLPVTVDTEDQEHTTCASKEAAVALLRELATASVAAPIVVYAAIYHRPSAMKFGARGLQWSTVPEIKLPAGRDKHSSAENSGPLFMEITDVVKSFVVKKGKRKRLELESKAMEKLAVRDIKNPFVLPLLAECLDGKQCTLSWLYQFLVV